MLIQYEPTFIRAVPVGKRGAALTLPNKKIISAVLLVFGLIKLKKCLMSIIYFLLV